jgi:hypothetical protein
MEHSNSRESLEINHLKLKKAQQVIKDKLLVASILCNKSSIYYNRFKMFLVVPNLFISSCSAIVNNQDLDVSFLKIFNTVINTITVLLLGLQTSFRVSEMTDIYKNQSNALVKLMHEQEGLEMKNTLTFDNITSITERYDTIMGNLMFPSYIMKQVRDEYGTKKHLPMCINHIEKTFIEPASPSRTFIIPNGSV